MRPKVGQEQEAPLQGQAQSQSQALTPNTNNEPHVLYDTKFTKETVQEIYNDFERDYTENSQNRTILFEHLVTNLRNKIKICPYEACYNEPDIDKQIDKLQKDTESQIEQLRSQIRQGNQNNENPQSLFGNVDTNPGIAPIPPTSSNTVAIENDTAPIPTTSSNPVIIKKDVEIEEDEDDISKPAIRTVPKAKSKASVSSESSSSDSMASFETHERSRIEKGKSKLPAFWGLAKHRPRGSSLMRLEYPGPELPTSSVVRFYDVINAEMEDLKDDTEDIEIRNQELKRHDGKKRSFKNLACESGVIFDPDPDTKACTESIKAWTELIDGSGARKVDQISQVETSSNSTPKDTPKSSMESTHAETILEQQLKSDKQDLLEEIQLQKSINEKLQETINSLEQKMNISGNENNVAEKLQKSEAEVERLIQENSTLRNHLGDLKTDLKECKLDISTNTQTITEQNNLINNLQQKIEEAKQIESQLQEKISKKDQELGQSQVMVQALEESSKSLHYRLGKACFPKPVASSIPVGLSAEVNPYELPSHVQIFARGILKNSDVHAPEAPHHIPESSEYAGRDGNEIERERLEQKIKDITNQYDDQISQERKLKDELEARLHIQIANLYLKVSEKEKEKLEQGESIKLRQDRFKKAYFEKHVAEEESRERVKELEQQIQDHKTICENLREYQNKLIEETRAENKDLKKRIESLENEIRDRLTERDERKDDLAIEYGYIYNQIRESAQTMGDIDALLENIEETHRYNLQEHTFENIQVLKEREKDLERLNNEIKVLQNELQKEKVAHDTRDVNDYKRKRESSETVGSLEDQVRELQIEIEGIKKSSESHSAGATKNEQEDEISRLKEQIKSLEAENYILKVEKTRRERSVHEIEKSGEGFKENDTIQPIDQITKPNTEVQQQDIASKERNNDPEEVWKLYLKIDELESKIRWIRLENKKMKESSEKELEKTSRTTAITKDLHISYNAQIRKNDFLSNENQNLKDIISKHETEIEILNQRIVEDNEKITNLVRTGAYTLDLDNVKDASEENPEKSEALKTSSQKQCIDIEEGEFEADLYKVISECLEISVTLGKSRLQKNGKTFRRLVNKLNQKLQDCLPASQKEAAQTSIIVESDFPESSKSEQEIPNTGPEIQSLVNSNQILSTEDEEPTTNLSENVPAVRGLRTPEQLPGKEYLAINGLESKLLDQSGEESRLKSRLKSSTVSIRKLLEILPELRNRDQDLVKQIVSLIEIIQCCQSMTSNPESKLKMMYADIHRVVESRTATIQKLKSRFRLTHRDFQDDIEDPSSTQVQVGLCGAGGGEGFENLFLALIYGNHLEMTRDLIRLEQLQCEKETTNSNIFNQLKVVTEKLEEREEEIKTLKSSLQKESKDPSEIASQLESFINQSNTIQEILSTQVINEDGSLYKDLQQLEQKIQNSKSRHEIHSGTRIKLILTNDMIYNLILFVEEQNKKVEELLQKLSRVEIDISGIDIKELRHSASSFLDSNDKISGKLKGFQQRIEDLRSHIKSLDEE